jgi:hypothetical protein
MQACTRGLSWTEMLNLAFCCRCLALNARKLQPPSALLSYAQKDVLECYKANTFFRYTRFKRIGMHDVPRCNMRCTINYVVMTDDHWSGNVLCPDGGTPTTRSGNVFSCFTLCIICCIKNISTQHKHDKIVMMHTIKLLQMSCASEHLVAAKVVPKGEWHSYVAF